MLRTRVALAALLLLGCGGEPAPAEPTPVASAGAETPPDPAPAGPSPEAVAEVRDLVVAIGLGPTEATAARLRAAQVESDEVNPVRAACLQLVEAFVAGSVEAFDPDAQCFARVEELRAAHGVAEPLEVGAYRALVAASRQERRAALPPLPPGFATESDEVGFEGELADGDPQLGNGRAYDDHVVELAPGWTVTIDMTSPSFDTFLYLLGEGGQELAADDDGGEGLNSRITYAVEAPGRYTVRASAFSPRGRGAYRVGVTLVQP